MTKYLKVTDNGHVGYHSVPDDFRPPYPAAHESFEFVDEAEALGANPDLGTRNPAKK